MRLEILYYHIFFNQKIIILQKGRRRSWNAKSHKYLKTQDGEIKQGNKNSFGVKVDR